MYSITKFIFCAAMFAFAGWASNSEFKDIQKDDEIVYSEVDKSLHAASCECGYCQEESAYYMEIAGYDSTIRLGQTLTVLSIDTVENLTCVTLEP